MRVLLFGMIAEKAGVAEVHVDAGSTHALRSALEQRIPGLAKLSYSISVDRRMVHADVPLRGDEEVAALPPFAGG